MNSKSEEEKREINLKKFNKTSRYSKKSISFFELLLRNTSYTDLTFLYKEKEFFIYDYTKKKIFFYDFYIPELKIIIEYHGVMFHPKEDEINKKNWKCLFSNISYEDKMEYDLYKIKIAKDSGIDLLVIWEDENLNDAINKCLKIIKDKYDNYTREKNGTN
jgi:very-short-patch-repair endonuclease